MELEQPIETIEEVLGVAARKSFERGAEELACYVRSIALVSLKIPEETVRKQFASISLGIIVNAVKASVEARLGDGEVSSGVICGKRMHVEPELMEINNRKQEIIDCLVDFSMELFSKGRKLGRQIVSRARPMGRRPSLSEKSPLEAIEVEIMRLENKLPNISKIEALRLGDCYQMAERR